MQSSADAKVHRLIKLMRGSLLKCKGPLNRNVWHVGQHQVQLSRQQSFFDKQMNLHFTSSLLCDCKAAPCAAITLLLLLDEGLAVCQASGSGREPCVSCDSPTRCSKPAQLL
jgi:hypothetical protein